MHTHTYQYLLFIQLLASRIEINTFGPAKTKKRAGTRAQLTMHHHGTMRASILRHQVFLLWQKSIDFVSRRVTIGAPCGRPLASRL